MCQDNQTQKKKNALTVNRTQDLQIFSLTLSQLSYQSLIRPDDAVALLGEQQIQAITSTRDSNSLTEDRGDRSWGY